METFDIPIQIMTTSLHDILHHDLHSPHRHSPIFFTFNPHFNKNISKSDKQIKAYKEKTAKEKNDERLIELLMVSSQSWT
jgi:hypothetical protein